MPLAPGKGYCAEEGVLLEPLEPLLASSTVD